MRRFRNWVRDNFPETYAILRLPRVWYRPTQKDLLRRELKRQLTGRRDLFFVQVGSNDGLHNDPIRPFVLKHQDWRGIFIEPVVSLFEQLVINYNHDPRFIFENIAVGTERTKREFYYVSDDARQMPNVPGWYNQLGSFSKEHILKHCEGALAPYIISRMIETEPLADLLKRHNVQKLNLLHIDTEGYDYHVLRTLDFSWFHPDVILYEHEHLSHEAKLEMSKLLHVHGYHTREYGGDTLATKR